jgi:hypothetical protein
VGGCRVTVQDVAGVDDRAGARGRVPGRGPGDGASPFAAMSVLHSRYAGNGFDATAGSNASTDAPNDSGQHTVDPAAQAAELHAVAQQRRQLPVRGEPLGGRQLLHGRPAMEKLLPMGGFSGNVPQPTLQQVRELVARGKLRFFLLRDDEGSGPSGKSATSTVNEITSWVKSTCTKVPAAAPTRRGPPTRVRPKERPPSWPCTSAPRAGGSLHDPGDDHRTGRRPDRGGSGQLRDQRLNTSRPKVARPGVAA